MPTLPTSYDCLPLPEACVDGFAQNLAQLLTSLM